MCSYGGSFAPIENGIRRTESPRPSAPPSFPLTSDRLSLDRLVSLLYHPRFVVSDSRVCPASRGQLAYRRCGYTVIVTEINRELLEILACPKTKAPLIQSGDWLYSTDPETKLRYPIRNGIPIMLIEEAESVDQTDFERVIGHR